MKRYVFIGAFIGGLLSALLLIFLFVAFKNGIGWYFWAENEKQIAVFSEVVLPLASTFFGAAAGSYYTYKLQLASKRAEQTEKDIHLIQKAFLVLESQFNDLATIKMSMMVPNKDKYLRFLSLPITIGYVRAIAALDQDFALPLIRFKESETLNRARLAEKSYLNVLALQEGFHDILEEYNGKLQAAGVGQLDITSLKKKFSLAGAGTVCQLYVLGEELIGQLDGAIIDLFDVLDKICKMFEKNFDASTYGSLKMEVMEGSAQVMQQMPPPKVTSIDHLLMLAEYTPRYHDPDNDEVTSVIRLASQAWRPSIYNNVSFNGSIKRSP